MVSAKAKLGILSFLLFSVAFVGADPVDAKIILDTSGKGEMVALIGDVSREDVNDLAKILESKKLKVNFLLLENSNGGDAYAAMDLGRIVRKNNFGVAVLDKCFSACALVYISGVHRTNGGVVGLHRPYFAGSPMPTAQVEPALKKMFADIKGYVAEMNVTEEFDAIMLNTDPTNMRTYVKKEIEALVPAHDPFYDELITALWARVYGVSTEEFRRRRAYADANCTKDYNKPSSLAGMNANQSCTWATYWGLPVSVFEARFLPALKMCPPISDESLLSTPSKWDNPILIQNETCMRRAMLTSYQETNNSAEAAAVRFRQNTKGETVELTGLANDSGCSAVTLNGSVVKREFANDAAAVTEFVIESADGTRAFVNVIIPSGLDNATRRAVFDGLQRLLKIGRAIRGHALSCGSGQFLYLEQIQ